MFKNHVNNLGDDVIMEWAKVCFLLFLCNSFRLQCIWWINSSYFVLQENKNYLLQIVCGYHTLPLPPRGHEIVFRPLEHLQAVKYKRPAISDLGLGDLCVESLEDPEVFPSLYVNCDSVCSTVPYICSLHPLSS